MAKAALDNDTLRLGTCGTVINKCYQRWRGGILFTRAPPKGFGSLRHRKPALADGKNPFVIARHKL